MIRDRLNRLYPLPSKRLAPDFFFQPQIYRADGETVRLPAGYYTIAYNGGPESLPHTREVEVNARGTCRSSLFSSTGGSIPRSPAGIRATTTSTPPAARTT